MPDARQLIAQAMMPRSRWDRFPASTNIEDRRTTDPLTQFVSPQAPNVIPQRDVGVEISQRTPNTLSEQAGLGDILAADFEHEAMPRPQSPYANFTGGLQLNDLLNNPAGRVPWLDNWKSR